MRGHTPTRDRRFDKQRILKSSCTLVNQPAAENKTKPVFKDDDDDASMREPRDGSFPFNTPIGGDAASTAAPAVPFQRNMYVPPTTNNMSGDGVQVSIGKEVIVPIIILCGGVSFLIFVFCSAKMYLRSRGRPRTSVAGNPDYEEYEEESNRCSLFFRTTSPGGGSGGGYDNQGRTTVTEVDRGYDKNALLELRTKYTPHPPHPPASRLHLSEGNYVDYDYDDEEEEGEADGLGGGRGGGRKQRHVNETLHIDMNYKRRKKRFGVFYF